MLRYAERLVTHAATFRALADLRVWFFRSLARSAAGGLGFRQAGDVLARLVGDIEALDGLYLRILVPLAGAVLLLPVLVVLIGMHSVCAGTGDRRCCSRSRRSCCPGSRARMAARAGAALADAAGALRIAALDALTGLREVRAFGAEGRMLAAVQAREAALLATQHELAGRTALASAGALAVRAGGHPRGADRGRQQSGGRASSPRSWWWRRSRRSAGCRAPACLPAMPRRPRIACWRPPRRRCRCPIRRILRRCPSASRCASKRVHFRWQPDRPPVFDGLTLEVPQGARVALLGPSGAGKSTLAALALKVAAPQQGRVLLGGVDIATLAAADVRARIGWLAQATHLFDDTIRANLKLARPDADDAALWAALDAARIGEMVRALPDGLDTWVGEGGARFSGGQGRRLALARALLSPAPILILDEPCAGLDAETERAFLATLNEVAEGRSVILITHRLTGVERLDRIWRLSGGKAIAAAA